MGTAEMTPRTLKKAVSAVFGRVFFNPVSFFRMEPKVTLPRL